MTLGQIKAAAFVDELSKEADSLFSRIGRWTGNNPISTGAAMMGGMGAYDLARHGPWGKGRQSKPEAALQDQIQALQGQDQSDPAVQAELRNTLRKQRGEVAKEELVGSPLAVAGATGAGILANKKLLIPSLMKGEVGQSVSPEQVMRMAGSLKLDNPNLMGSMGGIGAARTIPKGGIFPKFMQSLEARRHTGLFKNELVNGLENSDNPAVVDLLAQARTNPELASQLSASLDADALTAAKSALKEGLIVTPFNAGAHLSAHELGHAAFGGSRLGKVTRALRLPGVGGVVAGSMAAGMADPDSTASKAAPAMAAAGMAPILGEEIAASLKGLKAMKSSGFSPAQLVSGRKQLAKAFGTYALGLGLPMISAPYLIRKVKQYNQSRREEQGLPSVGQLQQRISSLPQTQE